MLDNFRKPTTQKTATQKASSTNGQLYMGDSVKNSEAYTVPSRNNHYTSYNNSHSQYDNYSELRNNNNTRQPGDIGSTDEYYEESYLPTHDRMPVESLGYRAVQTDASKAISPEELRRMHQNASKPVQAVQTSKKDDLTHIQEKSVKREVQAAKEKLGSFNLEELIITKKGGFDMRFNKTKEYLAQCSAAEVDPLEYYNENISKERSVVQEAKYDVDTTAKGLNETSYYSVGGESVSKGKGGKDKEKEDGVLVHNMDGSLDMRYKKNQGVAMRIAEAKERLSRIDESKLVRTKTGKIDGRYKENKEYLELLKQCEESYYV